MNILVTQQMLDDNAWMIDAEFEAGKTYHHSCFLNFSEYYYSGFSTNPTPTKPRPVKPVAIT